MPGTLQPLDQQFAIVDGQGRPTLYFTRWAQQKQIDISNGITAAQANQLIADWSATRKINTSTGLAGGGSLAADRILVLADTAVTPGTYGDATHVPAIVVDQQGRITGVTLVAISGGGGGRYVANLGVLRPLTDFTQDNTNANRTIVENAGKAISFVAKATIAATNVHGLRRAVPGATPYRVAMFVQTNNPGFQFYGIAAGWSNGVAHHLVYDQSGGWEYAPWTNSSTRGAVTSLTGRAIPTGVGLWVGVRDDGVNWIWEISGDGGNFHPIRTMAKVAGYTQIYLGMFSYNNGASAESSATVLYYDENGLTRVAN